MNGKLIKGLLDKGSSTSLISFDTYDRLGKPRSIEVSSNKKLVANYSALKKVGSVDIKIQLNQNPGSSLKTFLRTADTDYPSFLVWSS